MPGGRRYASGGTSCIVRIMFSATGPVGQGGMLQGQEGKLYHHDAQNTAIIK